MASQKMDNLLMEMWKRSEQYCLQLPHHLYIYKTNV